MPWKRTLISLECGTPGGTFPRFPARLWDGPPWGSDAFAAPNPPFGATFTYWLKTAPTTAREDRRETERRLRQAGENVPFPGWERLRQESLETGPKLLLVVRDADGEPVRWVEGPAQPGVHRVAWDLRRPAPDPIDLSTPGFVPPWVTEPEGPLAPPGSYSVEMMMVSAEAVQSLGQPRTFQVKPVPTVPAETDFQAVAAFQQEASELIRRVAGAGEEVGRVQERLRYMRAALLKAPDADPALFQRMDDLARTLDGIQTRLTGDRIRASLNEPAVPSVNDRLSRIREQWATRLEPTATMREDLRIASGDFDAVSRDLTALVDGELARLEEDLAAAGAPWIPGQRVGGGG